MIYPSCGESAFSSSEYENAVPEGLRNSIPETHFLLALEEKRLIEETGELSPSRCAFCSYIFQKLYRMTERKNGYGEEAAAFINSWFPDAFRRRMKKYCPDI